MLKVLAAEDDAETRAYVERGLRELGHAVISAADGRDALFLAIGEQFDAVVFGRIRRHGEVAEQAVPVTA